MTRKRISKKLGRRPVSRQSQFSKSQILTQIASAAMAPSTPTSWTLLQLVGSDIKPTRQFTVDRFDLEFGPQLNTTGGVNINQFLYVQASVLDPATNALIPLTQLKSLSTTTPVRMKVNVPAHLKHYFSLSLLLPYLTITAYNAAGAGALLSGAYVKIDTQYHLVPDVPTVV
jgi:hypothetical protein